MSEIRALVSQLEYQLNSRENSIKAGLKISHDSKTELLDDLFLTDNFEPSRLIYHIPLFRETSSASNSSDFNQAKTESLCLQEACTRLRAYIDSLNEHIIHIVESESHEFVEVAHNLEAFRREVFTELKEAVGSVRERYHAERIKAEEKLLGVAHMVEEASAMERERARLERLLEAQEGYERLKGRVLGAKGCGEVQSLEIEEAARMLEDLKAMAKEAQDQTFNHCLLVVERSIKEILEEKFEKFIKTSSFFQSTSTSKSDDYFEDCEFSSCMRIFKLLNYEASLYDKLQNLVIKPQLLDIIKKTYEAKNDNSKQPFEVFTTLVLTDIVSGSLRRALILTSDETNFNYVSDLHLLREVLWPLFLYTFDQSLSFTTSSYTGSTQNHFPLNFKRAQSFIHELKRYCEGSEDFNYLEELTERFNLQTYLNLLAIESSEAYQGEIERMYESTSAEGLRPISEVTMRYAMRMIDPEQVYLKEIGDKLIKLAIQFIVRNLNFVLDKLNEKKTMSTERVLFILEDLSRLQTSVREVLFPSFNLLLLDLNPDSPNPSSLLAPLLHELSLRFDHLVEPCLVSLSTRLSQRLIENLSAFKQVPSHYRMLTTTSTKPLSNKYSVPSPSLFLEQTLRPLSSLATDQKMFAAMSPEVRRKLYDQVLSVGMKELQRLLGEIIGEERKMHESLRKYKRDDDAQKGNISDFDKMQLQFYVDVKELSRQIDILMEAGKDDLSAEKLKFNQVLKEILESLSQGRATYDRLQ